MTNNAKEDTLAYARALERLLQLVQELSSARELAAIMAIVRGAARELTGADGASFVLRDGDQCFYADEDAIQPLWKGQRFPLHQCISGWAMVHREAVVIEDIYADPRIPAAAYQPTFVTSLAIVPIRRLAPIGAIGIYWATQHRPTEPQVRLLQALADATSSALANVELSARFESRLAERTCQLEAANRELEAFSYAVSHDLRAPLRAIGGFSQILLEDHADKLAEGTQHLDRIRAATGRMSQLIDDLLELSRMSRSELVRAPIDLAAIAREVVDELRLTQPGRRVDVVIADALPAHGDARLMRLVLENLIRNAWKFSAKREVARIEIGQRDGAFFVQDDGVGFDAVHATKLFVPFQRMHAAADFEGTGVGLATAQRIVVRHGGRISAHSTIGHGATFSFALPADH